MKYERLSTSDIKDILDNSTDPQQLKAAQEHFLLRRDKKEKEVKYEGTRIGFILKCTTTSFTSEAVSVSYASKYENIITSLAPAKILDFSHERENAEVFSAETLKEIMQHIKAGYRSRFDVIAVESRNT